MSAMFDLFKRLAKFRVEICDLRIKNTRLRKKCDELREQVKFMSNCTNCANLDVCGQKQWEACFGPWDDGEFCYEHWRVMKYDNQD